MKQIARRALLRKSTLAVVSAGIGLPLLPVEASSDVSNASRKLKVIVAEDTRMSLNLSPGSSSALAYRIRHQPKNAEAFGHMEAGAHRGSPGNIFSLGGRPLSAEEVDAECIAIRCRTVGR